MNKIKLILLALFVLVSPSLVSAQISGFKHSVDTSILNKTAAGSITKQAVAGRFKELAGLMVHDIVERNDSLFFSRNDTLYYVGHDETGGSDSTVFTTIFRSDTAKINIRALVTILFNQTNVALDEKQPLLGYTPENVANKSLSLDNSPTKYPASQAVFNALQLKPDSVKLYNDTIYYYKQGIARYGGKVSTHTLQQITDAGASTNHGLTIIGTTPSTGWGTTHLTLQHDGSPGVGGSPDNNLDIINTGNGGQVFNMFFAPSSTPTTNQNLQIYHYLTTGFEINSQGQNSGVSYKWIPFAFNNQDVRGYNVLIGGDNTLGGLMTPGSNRLWVRSSSTLGTENILNLVDSNNVSKFRVRADGLTYSYRLKTVKTAPLPSGTTKFVTVDTNGMFSFSDVGWNVLTGKPTTALGFGITDVYDKDYIDAVQSSLESVIISKQAQDGDLTAIAALNGIGYPYRISGSTWALRDVDARIDSTAEALQNNIDAVSGAGVSDGDKGDVIVSSTGSVWTIDNNAVTSAKISSLAWSKVTGTPTDLAGYGITDAYTKDEVDAIAIQKQNILLFDSTPANGSNNPVTSDGIYDAIQLRQFHDDDLDALAGASGTGLWKKTGPGTGTLVAESTFATASHDHDAADIISGTIDPDRMGADADENLVLRIVGGVPTWTVDNEGGGLLQSDGVDQTFELWTNFTSPFVISNSPGMHNTISIPQADATHDGYMDKDDFAAIQDAINAMDGLQPLDADLTAIAALSPSNDDFIQRKSGAWTNRTVAQVKTDLAVNNVDNTSDATKNAATATLTNKTIDGDNNTLQDIVYSSLKSGTIQEHITLAISDETTDLTTGTAKITFRMPYAATITAVRASVNTASSSGTPTFDVNEGGTTILSTKLTIDASEKTSTTAATAAVISDSSIADDAEMTVDIDVAGTGAKGAKITIYYTR